MEKVTVIPLRNVRTSPWHGRKDQPVDVPVNIAEHWINSGYARPAAAKKTGGK